jgi:hypothetical protein
VALERAEILGAVVVRSCRQVEAARVAGEVDAGRCRCVVDAERIGLQVLVVVRRIDESRLAFSRRDSAIVPSLSSRRREQSIVGLVAFAATGMKIRI